MTCCYYLRQRFFIVYYLLTQWLYFDYQCTTNSQQGHFVKTVKVHLLSLNNDVNLVKFIVDALYS